MTRNQMQYDQAKYKKWDWKNPYFLHWVINPGVVISELVLGQTVPKVMLFERNGKQSLIQRSYVPCPHCGTIHSALKWSVQNKTAFRNWYGLYCDNCGEIIPVLRNVFSLLLLALSFPVWGWFRKRMKQRWLAHQPQRYTNISLEVSEELISTKSWLRRGLMWAVFMYLVMLVVTSLAQGQNLDSRQLLIGIPIWLVMGLFFGWTMKWLMNKKGKVVKDTSE